MFIASALEIGDQLHVSASSLLGKKDIHVFEGHNNSVHIL
jgi:hypothetical protein